MSEVGTGVEETLDNQLLPESQINFGAREKTIEVREVLVEKVKDATPMLQLEGAPN
jgi:hypothetical protein